MFPRPTHGPDSLDKEPFYCAERAIEGVVSQEPDELNRLSGRYAGLLNDIPPGLNYSFYTEEMGHPNPIFAWRSKFSDFLYKADPNMPVRTIKASGGAYTGPLHWENRFFTCEEYKRLQTFPDDYRISGSKQTAVKQIGNSVPPQLARMMAIAIRMEVFGTKFPFELSLLQEGEELTFRKRKRELTKIYKKKAEMAIKALKSEPGALPGRRGYGCRIDSKFCFEEVCIADAQFTVDVDWAEELRIEVTDVKKVRERAVVSATVVPGDGCWVLGVKRVVLMVRADVLPGYPHKGFYGVVRRESGTAEGHGRWYHQRGRTGAGGACLLVAGDQGCRARAEHPAPQRKRIGRKVFVGGRDLHEDFGQELQYTVPERIRIAQCQSGRCVHDAVTGGKLSVL